MRAFDDDDDDVNDDDDDLCDGVCVSLSQIGRNVVYFEKDTRRCKNVRFWCAAAARYYEGGVLGFTNTSFTMKVLF